MASSVLAPAQARVTHVHRDAVCMVASVFRSVLTPPFMEALEAVISREAMTLLDPCGQLPEWVPTEHLAEVVHSIESLSGLETGRIRGEMLERVASRDAPEDPLKALLVLPAAFARMYRGGELRVVPAGPNRAQLLLEALLPCASFYRWAFPTMVRSLLEEQGIKAPSVTYQPPKLGESPILHVYQVQWT